MDDVTSFKENAYNTLEAKQSDKINTLYTTTKVTRWMF